VLDREEVGGADAPGSGSALERDGELERGAEEVMMEKFRIGLVQMSCATDPNENLAKAEWKIREAAARGGQIICLQELFRSQYFCREENHEMFALAEPIPGPSTEALGKLARELGVVIIASLFERRAAGVYHNTAAVIGTDGGIIGIYRKMHIPDDPLYFEKYYFTPGDLGFKVFTTQQAKIGTRPMDDGWQVEVQIAGNLDILEILNPEGRKD
jgi:N-carbamoylputrescine amidase